MCTSIHRCCRGCYRGAEPDAVPMLSTWAYVCAKHELFDSPQLHEKFLMSRDIGKTRTLIRVRVSWFSVLSALGSARGGAA
jgi:hypothetical protein